MLVIPEARAVLYKFDNIAEAKKLIPFGQELEVEGSPHLLIPHHEDSIKYLRNIGVPVPGMMATYYDWPGKFKPFNHQKVTADFIYENKVCFVLNDIGTGKTASVIWALEYLRKRGVFKRIIIASTKSTLRDVWEAEIAGISLQADVAVVHGSPAKRKKLLSEEHDYYIMTHAGLKWYVNNQREDIDCLVIDELGEFSNAQTQGWKALNVLTTKIPYRIGITGQPTPRAPTDAWAQAKVMKTGRGNVPKYFGTFRREVMQQVMQNKWIPIPGWERRVHEILQPAVRFSRDDCLDLPETTYSYRQVELSETQEEIYKLMKKDLYAEYKQGKILAANELVKVMRLVQVASGVVYDVDSNHLIIGAQDRIEELKRVYDESNGKLIVFAPYAGTIEYIAQELKDFAPIAVVTGKTSLGERTKIFNSFQTSDEIRMLVAQPGTMAHGLTLTRAATTLWFAPINSNRIYTQANGRIVRATQTKKTNIIHLFATAEERRMYRALQYQQTMGGILLAEFEKETKSWT